MTTFMSVKILLLFWVIIFSSATISGENDTQLLIKADSVRSSNPEQSKFLLDSINPSQLNSAERDLFQYLTIYNQSLTGSLDEAKNNFKKLITKETVYDVQQRALASLLTMLTGMKNWAEALPTANLLLDSLNSSIPVKSLQTLENTHSSLAVFYNHIGEHQLAQHFAGNLIKNSDSPRRVCAATSVFLYSQIELSPTDIQAEDFLNAITLCNTANETILKSSVVAHMAKYFLVIQKPQNAINVLEKYVSEVEASNYKAMTASFYGLMAKGYLALFDHPQAEKYARILIDTKAEHQYEQAITTAYKVLSEVVEKRGNFEQANFYYKKYFEAERINFDQENAKLLAIQKARQDTLEKTNQISLLDKENDLLKIQAALNKEAAQNDRLTMGLLALVTLLILLWAYKNRRAHIKLRYMAQTDELTGIANRHHFNQLCAAALDYCQKTRQPLSFILLDLDFFKKINDNFGHQVGDWALKEACHNAKSVCRNNDIIGRMGGEEFGILLPSCSLEKAMQIAEQCRQAIAALDSTESGQQFKLTASFGVADAETCGYHFDKLFAGADTALYRSKDLGRNQVYSYKLDQLSLNVQV